MESKFNLEALHAIQEKMIEDELLKTPGISPIVKTAIDFGIRGMDCLRFITTWMQHAADDVKKSDEE